MCVFLKENMEKTEIFRTYRNFVEIFRTYIKNVYILRKIVCERKKPCTYIKNV